MIVETAIATPSQACCALAAKLLRVLPLNILHTAGLFDQAELDPSEFSWSHSAAMSNDALTFDVPCCIR